MPSLGYRVSGKEVEVPDSGSRHHQLCGCCNLQLIQCHEAPSHSPPARVLSPPKPCGPPPSMAAAPRFKSQHPSSFAAPFPTPPTISYTCQHPRILPALLGCHSKSGQVWPHGLEPIISTLSRRPCNQGVLLPSPILGGSHSHSPGSKHGHCYLTHP